MAEKLIQVMKCIINNILKEGNVPQDWKRSRVTLIHKGGGKAKEEIENYRLISIVNILTKVFGTIINEKLTSLAEQSMG